MRKNTKIILSTVSVLAAAGIIAGSYFININDEKPEVTPAPSTDVTITETPGVEPNDNPATDLTGDSTKEPTVEPTKEPETDLTVETTVAPTTEPTEEPVVTVEPTKEPEEEPTKVPDITVTTAPTNTPTPILPCTPTPTPTSTPTPTPSQTPTVTPMPNANLVERMQMGDNVYFDFYDNDVLVVTGTGATWDFDATFEDVWDYGYVYRWSHDERLDAMNHFQTIIRTIVIEEGVTKIGDWALSCYSNVKNVTFPSTLESIGYAAFYDLGDNDYYSDADVTLIGLDISKVNMGEHVFYSSKVKDRNYAVHVASPTPTCTPTPTPTPNPEKPRLLRTQQMGNNVTYELWDNDTIYVKGTGATWDVEYYTLESISAKKIVVEEGITHLGKCSLFIEFDELVLPSTLKSVGYAGHFDTGDIVTAYKDGKITTLTVPETNDRDFIGRFLEDSFGIKGPQ